ncbi:MAG: hypothetical protein RIT27_2316 [Pseudomonadota bacterium]|jgi:hypothetical protein
MPIPLSDFEATAKKRLDDAIFLARDCRYDSAVYLGGYALEIALKISMAKKNGLHNVPEKKSECNNPSYVDNASGSSKKKYHCTHDLLLLLKESNVYGVIMGDIKYNKDFDFIHKHWSPENRYKNQRISNTKMIELLEAIERLVRVIL